MPQIFKALTSISAWTLFIGGWVFFLQTTIMALVGEAPEWERRATFLGLAVLCIFLAPVAMKIRRGLE